MTRKWLTRRLKIPRLVEVEYREPCNTPFVDGLEVSEYLGYKLFDTAEEAIDWIIDDTNQTMQALKEQITLVINFVALLRSISEEDDE